MRYLPPGYLPGPDIKDDKLAFWTEAVQLSLLGNHETLQL